MPTTGWRRSRRCGRQGMPNKTSIEGMTNSCCLKCGGVMFFDDGLEDKYPLPSVVCHRGHRIELDADGNSLLVKIPALGMEQHIRLLHRQGRSKPKIARSLGCSWELVRQVIAEMDQP